jgi:hypothetical protein
MDESRRLGKCGQLTMTAFAIETERARLIFSGSSSDVAQWRSI